LFERRQQKARLDAFTAGGGVIIAQPTGTFTPELSGESVTFLVVG
jgi:hypothetical protein